MKIIRFKKSFAQRNIAVKLWQPLSHGSSEPVIHLLRHLIGVKIIGTAGIIFSGSGIKNSLLYIGCKCCRQCIGILLVYTIQAFKSRFTDLSLRVLHKGNKGTMSHRKLSAVTSCNGWKTYVCIVKHTKYLSTALSGFFRTRQQPFHLMG